MRYFKISYAGFVYGLVPYRKVGSINNIALSLRIMLTDIKNIFNINCWLNEQCLTHVSYFNRVIISLFLFIFGDLDPCVCV